METEGEGEGGRRGGGGGGEEKGKKRVKEDEEEDEERGRLVGCVGVPGRPATTGDRRCGWARWAVAL